MKLIVIYNKVIGFIFFNIIYPTMFREKYRRCREVCLRDAEALRETWLSEGNPKFVVDVWCKWFIEDCVEECMLIN